MSECADTQDLKGGCDSGGEGKGGFVHSEKRDLTSTLRAVDKLVVLYFEVHMLETGYLRIHVRLAGILPVITCCVQLLYDIISRSCFSVCDDPENVH